MQSIVSADQSDNKLFLITFTGIPPNVTYIEPLANLDLTATLARRRRVHYADPPAASSHSQCTAAIRDALSAPKQELPSSAASDITPLTSSGRDHRRDSSTAAGNASQGSADCGGQNQQSPYISGEIIWRLWLHPKLWFQFFFSKQGFIFETTLLTIEWTNILDIRDEIMSRCHMQTS